jgi:hypothetical protein
MTFDHLLRSITYDNFEHVCTTVSMTMMTTITATAASITVDVIIFIVASIPV